MTRRLYGVRRSTEGPERHNYFRKVMSLVEEKPFPVGVLSHVYIYHDDWCGIFRGEACDCDPVVVRGGVEGRG